MPNIPITNEVIVDTGFWVALGNRNDRYHSLALAWLNQHDGGRLITTWPVVVETCYLLVNRGGMDQPQKFLRLLENPVIRLFDLDKLALQRMQQLMYKYATLPMDFADASLVILAESIGHGYILSTDQRDFDVYPWKSHWPFTNVFLPDSSDP